jgi:small ligand-binding sensory domain FIST
VDQDDTSTSTGLDDAREGTKKTPSDAFGATLTETEKTKQTPVISAAAAAAEARAARAYGEGGAGYVYRDIVGADHETGGVFVGSTHALREGSCVQLHVRDAAWGKERVKALLKRIADDRNPPAGAVMYTCVSGNRMHAGDFREAVGYCPLGGGFVAGEIAPSERGARAALQSHTSVVAVFRERDGDAA